MGPYPPVNFLPTKTFSLPSHVPPKSARRINFYNLHNGPNYTRNEAQGIKIMRPQHVIYAKWNRIQNFMGTQGKKKKEIVQLEEARQGFTAELTIIIATVY